MFPFEQHAPSPACFSPLSFLHRLAEINKYSCKKLIDFQIAKCGCVIHEARFRDILQNLVPTDCCVMCSELQTQAVLMIWWADARASRRLTLNMCSSTYEQVHIPLGLSKPPSDIVCVLHFLSKVVLYVVNIINVFFRASWKRHFCNSNWLLVVRTERLDFASIKVTVAGATAKWQAQFNTVPAWTLQKPHLKLWTCSICKRGPTF